MTGDTRGWKTSPHFFTTSKLLLWRRSSGLGPVCLGQTRVVTLQGVTAFYASWRKTVRSGQRGWKKKTRSSRTLREKSFLTSFWDLGLCFSCVKISCFRLITKTARVVPSPFWSAQCVKLLLSVFTCTQKLVFMRFKN